VGNVLVALYMYKVVPEFVLRLCAFLVSNVVYRVRVIGAHHVPVDGACVIAANHVSYVDWLVLAGGVPRPPRFVMDRTIYRMWVFHWLFRQARAIPIVPRREDEAEVQRALQSVHEELAADGVIGIFPEGALTRDGEMAPFRRGIEEILARDPVPVVPVALVGLWGSYFSRKDGAALRRPLRRFWSRVVLVIGEPMPAEGLTADALRERVAQLHAMGEAS
jgi:1-acyl-sn-glycerol-3-phosphate acyltransferase